MLLPDEHGAAADRPRDLLVRGEDREFYRRDAAFPGEGVRPDAGKYI